MRIVAITVLGLFLLLNLAGALVDSHTEVERELVTTSELDPARLAELTGDLARLSEWAPAFQEGAGYELEIQPGERTVGEDGAVTLVFDGQHAILLMIASFEPAGSIVVEARMGAVGDDLIGGDGFKAHQDAQAGWNVYADYHVTALVSIDAATPENGCLEMAAGWHNRGLIGDEWRPLDDGDGSEVVYRSCPTQPGDVVFFDSYAPHRSAPNLTAAPRRVLYITYNRLSDGDHRAQYYADKRNSFPPDIERDAGKEYVFRV